MEALSRIFMDSLNPICYEEFTRGIESAFTKGHNIYPANVVEAVEHIQNFNPRK